MVSAVRVRVPFRTPIRTAAGLWNGRDSWIVRIERDDGAAGWGEAALDSGADEADGNDLERLLAGAIEGRPIEGDGDAARAARCALESAVEWAGGARLGGGASVPVNATIGWREAAEGRAAVEQGFRTIKMKVGTEGSAAELAEGVAEMRAAIGPEVRLRLDANGAWSAEAARERLDAIAAFDVEYVEQPVAGVEELAAVRRSSPVRIAADESVTSPDAARRIVATRAADVMVVKLARVGGPGAAAEIAALAADEGIDVVFSTLFETGVGLAAAVRAAAALGVGDRRAHGLATASLLESSLLSGGLETRDGAIVADNPAIDEEEIRRFAVAWLGER